MIDSTIVRARQHSAGALKKVENQAWPQPRRAEQQDPCAGRRARQSAALSADAGTGARPWPSPGQALAGADALLPHMTANLLIADRAFNADRRILDPLAAAGKSAVIPPRPNRSTLRQFDRELYKERHLIESFFCKLKQFRATATRCDKTARNFLAAIHLVAATIWLN
jgi:transposase